MEQKESGLDLSFDGSGLKQVFTILAVVFGVALAVMIGRRISSDALAIVIGVACGLAASLPTTLLLLFVLSRRDRPREEGRYGEEARRYPPVVVIQGGTGQALPPPGLGSGYWPAGAPPLRREFQVVDARGSLQDDTDYWG